MHKQEMILINRQIISELQETPKTLKFLVLNNKPVPTWKSVPFSNLVYAMQGQGRENKEREEFKA